MKVVKTLLNKNYFLPSFLEFAKFKSAKYKLKQVTREIREI